MKTLADVKRKMTLGSKWRCVRLFEGGKDLGVREVGKVQGNAVAFLKPDGETLVAMVAKGKGRAGRRKTPSPCSRTECPSSSTSMPDRCSGKNHAK